MKRVYHYARYFFYFFFHYSPVLAFCLLVDEIRGEKKYHIKSVGFQSIRQFHELYTTGAYSYMPSNYRLLEKLFHYVNTFQHNHSFIDIGCGKGRAMVVAANFGFSDIRGIDMIERYCHLAREHLDACKKSKPGLSYEVICCDATTFSFPDHIQTIFLYNPFEDWVLKRVIRNILASLEKTPRRIFIIYVNPSYGKSLLEAGFTEIFRTTRFRHLKASIFSNEN